MRVLSILICVLMSLSLKAQESCKEELKAILASFSGLDSPEEGKEHYLKYSVTAEAWDVAVEPSHDDLEIIYGKDFQVFKSSMVEMYQDTKSSFLVVPYKNTIIKSNSTIGTQNQGIAESIVKQKQLLTYSKVVKCSTTNNSNYNKIVVLDVPEKYHSLFQTTQLTYYINTTSNSIYKSIQSGTKSGQVKSITTVIHKFETNRKVSADIQKNVSKKFLREDGTLKKEYSDYELVNR